MLLLLPYAPPLIAAAVPVFDAVGGGSTAFAQTVTWSHTAAAGATVFLFGGYAGTPTTPTYAGTAMTVLTSVADTQGDIQALWKIVGVPGGPQTVSVGTSAGHNFLGNTVSVTGVNTVGTPATLETGPTAGPASQSVSCSTNQLILQGFQDSISGGLSASGGTLQWTDPAASVQSISTATISTTFTATLGGASDYWTGISVVLS